MRIIQGSVIGPLLFLIFLNDLVELLASVGINVKVFADDIKIYYKNHQQYWCKEIANCTWPDYWLGTGLAIAGLCRQMLCIKPW